MVVSFQNVRIQGEIPTTQHGLVSALMKQVSVNQLGLPEGIYRPDFLPSPEILRYNKLPGTGGQGTAGNQQTVQEGVPPASIMDGVFIEAHTSDDPQDSMRLPAPVTCFNHTPAVPLSSLPDIRSAYIPLGYNEGFPTLDGIPFWIQFPFEPMEAYKCFQLYLRQAKAGARQMYTLQEESDFPQQISTNDLFMFADLYFWAPRARSYDMFSAAHRRKERERRAIETEDDHYLLANRLMSIATIYLDEQEEELIEMMTPKMLLEFIKTSAQLRRISAGLPANGPSNSQEAEGPRGESTSLEVIMRTIAKENGHIQEAALMDGRTENRSKLQALLQDEGALALAQELVLKVNKQTPPSKPLMETV